MKKFQRVLAILLIAMMVFSGSISDASMLASFAATEDTQEELSTADKEAAVIQAEQPSDTQEEEETKEETKEEQEEKTDSKPEEEPKDSEGGSSSTEAKEEPDNTPAETEPEPETEPEVEEPQEEGVELREIRAKTVKEDLYKNQSDRKEDDRAPGYNAVTKLWKALTDRRVDSEEDKLDVDVTVRGMLPEGVTAEAEYITLNENSIYTEQGLFSLDITLYDKDGKEYIPEEPVEVIVKSSALKNETADDNALLVYSHQKAKSREEKLEKKLDKSVYAADIVVYKGEGVYDKLLAYEPYDEDKKYKDGEDAVRYTEDKGGLLVEKDTVTLAYDYSSVEYKDEKDDKKSASETMHFVFSSQMAKRTLTVKSGKANISVTGYFSKAVTLKAFEISEKNEDYNEYVEKTAEGLNKDAEEFTFARAFDIQLIDPSTGEEFQPDSEVNVSIKLADEKVGSDETVEVAHFAEGKEKDPEIIDSTNKGNTVKFTTDGFSVYVIIAHEGDTEVKTPRVEFHFIDPNYTESTATATVDGNEVTTFQYTAKGYEFVNKHLEDQITQIVKDGESLEKITNPANKKDSEDHEVSFFYGWYTVNKIEDTTEWDTNNNKWTGSIVYNLPDPQKIEFEESITISPSSGSNVGDEIEWTIGDATGTAKVDKNGTAHVYLAPMYEDFYFINFRMGNKEAEEGLRNNLLTRRLVVFGDKDTTVVRIGDMRCPSPDPAHELFSGWETVKEEGGSLVTDFYYETIDSEDNEYIKTLDENNHETTSAGPGYYITVKKTGSALSSLNLYPVFAEARWLYYDLGESGNGAKYVPASYILTNDEGKGKYYSNLLTTSRSGYVFGGWYLDKDNEHNGTGVQLTDSNGAFVDAVKGQKFYKAGENVVHAASWPAGAEKLYEVTEDGKLYFYKALDKLTVYAKWTPQTVPYTVVYWLENADDDDYTLMYYKNLEGIAGNQTNAQATKESDTYELNGKTYHPYEKYHLKFAHLSTDQNKDEAGDQSGIQNTEIDGDGSTIVNVYYDRNVYRLRFDIGFARRTSTSGSSTIYTAMTETEAASYSGVVYGVVDGSYKALTPDGNGGFTYEGTVAVRNAYDGYRYQETTGNATPQYGVANNEVVELNVTSDYVRADGYRYTPTTSNSGTQYGIFNNSINRVYYNYYEWRQTNNWNGTVYNGTRYTRDNATGGTTYNGDIYYAVNNGFSQNGSGDMYGFDGTRYFPITERIVCTYNGGTTYPENGKRYLRVANDNASTFYNLGFIDGEMKSVAKDSEGWYYNTEKSGTLTYSGTLYKQENLSGTWQYNVSNITGPNYASGNNWDTWLTSNEINLGTTNPFGPGEYNGTYQTTIGETPYMVYYYELVAKYGEVIMDRYPGTQPARNGAGPFVGWLAQRDSFYNARLSTSIKGTFETMSEDLMLTGGPIPGWNVKNANANPDNYTAITINDDNTITGEHGITQEFRCRYNKTSDSRRAYLYRMYLADPETREYSSEPTYKSIVVGGSGSHPNLQTPPTFQGYTLVDSKVLTSATDTTGVTPGDADYSYAVTELSEAGVGNGAIMVFKYQPNKHDLSYKYGSGAANPNEPIDPAHEAYDYYYNQSLADADRYTDVAEENIPEGYSFDGWYENPDGVGSKFNFNSKMPDGDVVLYAVYKPLKFMVKIDPNGAEIDHIDHTGNAYSGNATPLNRTEITYTEGGNTIIERPADSGYNKSQATYFFGNYGETVGEYNVSRSHVPISDTAAAIYKDSGRHVYAYVNLQYQGVNIDGQKGTPSDLRDALYVDATYGTGRYINDDSAQGETELYTLYKFYHDWIVSKYDELDCEGAKNLSYDAWKALVVEKQGSSNDIQLYRKCNSKEQWVFLGWFKDDETTPYNFSDPVTGSFKLTAKWRLDGGYMIQYTPEFRMSNGDIVNGSMESWTDPESGQLTYTDGAKTTVYKQPKDLTLNGSTVTDDSIIFRGWRIVSVTVNGSVVTYTPLEFDGSGNSVYYDPGDDFNINVGYADGNNIIHMQAVYELKSQAYRRPEIANLKLDANGGYLTAGSTSGTPVTDELTDDQNLPWKGVGTAALDADTDQILFGDIQSNTDVHLYKYATTLTENSKGTALDPAGINYFTHPLGHFLLGFVDEEKKTNHGFIADYPADSIISVQRKDDKTIYAVWEPMVYMNFVNNTSGNVTFGISANDNTALEIINVKNGIYDREPVTDYSNITVNAGETLKLAFPYGAEKDITISGTNTLGVGKALIWNSSVHLDGQDEPYTTVTGGDTVTYSHTAAGLGPHDHDLVTGETKNTKEFEFTESLITNSTPVTVTFSEKSYQYALLLKDNWNGDGTGGGMQEYDYSLEEIMPESGVPKTQELPKTSTRPMYEFLGWAFEPDATEPDFSATKPDGNPWTIADLEQFFSEGTYKVGESPDETTARDLYAVWRYEEAAHHVYIYKDVPEPGNKQQKFTFTVNIEGIYTYDAEGHTEPISASGTFELAHNEHADLHSTNKTQEGYIKTEVTVYDANGNLKTTDPIVITAQASHPSTDGHGKFNNTEHISVTETPVANYTTTIKRNSQVDNGYPIYVADSTDTTTNPLDNISGNTLNWYTTEAGGTVMFTNTRDTKDISVEKQLITDGEGTAIFSFTAGYMLTEIVNGQSVTTSVDLGQFNVTSGTTNTEALKKIPVGATLTITEAEDDNYKTTVKVGSGSPADGKTTSFEVVDDVTVLFENTLKSYPVKFIKTDQDGDGGKAEAFLKLSATSPQSYGLGPATLIANSQNEGVFYSPSTSEYKPLYAGYTYNLSETWVQNGYEGLDGPVTITVSGTAGNEFTFTDASGDTIADVEASFNSTDNVWEIKVKNQEVKDITVKKELSDPLVSQRDFTFTGKYYYKQQWYGLDGKVYDETKPYSFVLTPSTAAAASTVLTIPANATSFEVSEDTSLRVDPSSSTNTATFADTYKTEVALNGGTKVEGTKEEISQVTDDATITFTNTRKTVKVTVWKTVKGNDTTGSFSITATLAQGDIPVKGYEVGKDANNNPLTTGSSGTNAGQVTFSLVHNGTQDINVPVGASLTVEENLTTDQINAGFQPFMVVPGGSENMVTGDAAKFKLVAPAKDTTLRIFNIPCICKVTDGPGNLLYRYDDNGTTDPKDDVYIPAIYGLIKDAFADVNGLKLYSKSDSGFTPFTDTTYQIQMLTDYVVPDTDVVEDVTVGHTVTFTTAARDASDGYIFRSPRPYDNEPEDASDYVVGADDYRAVLTRVSGSTKAFFTINKNNVDTSTAFTLSDIIIDGRGADLENTVKGGCITAYISVITIDNSVIYDFEAEEGGAVYTTGASLTVNKSVFDICHSSKPLSGNGGGAINTEAITCKIDNTKFQDCSAIWQGGAVYHHNKLTNGKADSIDRSLSIDKCEFIGCFSRAGGGVEADIKTVTVSNSTFTNCNAQDVTYVQGGQTKTEKGTSGGGLNNYVNDIVAAGATSTELTVTNCTFQGCTALGTGNNYKGGGGIRSTSETTNLTGCEFTNVNNDTSKPCAATQGGGVSLTNTNANGAAYINGCTFTNCAATTRGNRNGGAIYAEVKNLTIQKNNEDGKGTSITTCSANNGGAVYTSGNVTITDNTVINNCTASSNGGGVYASGNASEIKGTAIIKGCTANSNGGGVYIPSGAKIKIDGSASIDGKGDSTSYKTNAQLGGGVYVLGTFEIAEGSSAEIRNCSSSSNGGAIYVKGSSANVLVNGGTISDNRAQGFGGGAIRVDDGAIVMITDGTITRNFITGNQEKCGGAIGIKQGTVNISGGEICYNYATGSGDGTNKVAQGGAIFVDGNSTAILNISGGTISNNYAEATSDGGYAYGGAINVKRGGIVNISGGTIRGNYVSAVSPANAKGAGIYLAEGSTLNISGDPSFGGADTDEEGSFNPAAGNLLTTNLPSGSTNGGKEYTNARQDIYIAGYNGTEAGSLNVTGEISSGTGAIWVWAEYGTSTHVNNDHIHKDDQFGLIADGVTATTFDAFRDARVDADSLAGSSPLYGIMSSTNTKHVIWGKIGGADVIFVKTDGYGDELQGAKFSIYNDLACTEIVNITPKVGSSTTEATSDDEGKVEFRAPVGVYYMKETTTPAGYVSNTKKYIVLVGSGNLTIPDPKPDTGIWSANGIMSGITQDDIDAQRGTTSTGAFERDSVIFLIKSTKNSNDETINKATIYPNIAKYGIMNVSKSERKTILRKVAKTSYDPLQGAKFRIYNADMSRYVKDEQTSGESGCFFIDDMPYGTYYLKETVAPASHGSNEGKWFCLIVDEGGTWMSESGYNDSDVAANNRAAALVDAKNVVNGN